MPFDPDRIGGIRWDIDKEENNYMDFVPSLSNMQATGGDDWGY